MNQNLLDMIACPNCQGPLKYDAIKQRLVCEKEQLAYPFEEGIPVLLPEAGLDISQEA